LTQALQRPERASQSPGPDSTFGSRNQEPAGRKENADQYQHSLTLPTNHGHDDGERDHAEGQFSKRQLTEDRGGVLVGIQLGDGKRSAIDREEEAVAPVLAIFVGLEALRNV
jgi:hypothetical protein